MSGLPSEFGCFLPKKKQVSSSSAPVFAFQDEEAQVGGGVTGAWQGLLCVGQGGSAGKAPLESP